MLRSFVRLVFFTLLLLSSVLQSLPILAQEKNWVGVVDMKMLILPGTASYLDDAISLAEKERAAMLVVKLDTPGGILQTTQEMVQSIFRARIPVAVYISPTGGTATSAGVFITMASHIAAMAPGTTIGAAHPVSGDGKDIEGDMRAKAENAAVSLVKAIADQRGRNTEWASQSVKESSSLTEKEAVDKKVVDLIATDLSDLLRLSTGRTVKVSGEDFVLPDLTSAEIRDIPIALRHEVVNILAHPNIAAILWLLATTGISIELYSPGLIIPGVVGVIALVLALAVGQVIPINFGAVALLGLGALLIGADLFVGSIALAVLGFISISLGALYIVDSQLAPGLSVSVQYLLPIILTIGGFLMLSAMTIAKGYRGTRSGANSDGIVGQRGKALDAITNEGRVRIGGAIWRAVVVGDPVNKDQDVVVKRALPGLKIEVEGIK